LDDYFCPSAQKRMNFIFKINWYQLRYFFNIDFYVFHPRACLTYFIIWCMFSSTHTTVTSILKQILESSFAALTNLNCNPCKLCQVHWKWAHTKQTLDSVMTWELFGLVWPLNRPYGLPSLREVSRGWDTVTIEWISEDMGLYQDSLLPGYAFTGLNEENLWKKPFRTTVRAGIWTPNLPILNRTRLSRTYGARCWTHIPCAI
jgi:hypothetical protein